MKSGTTINGSVAVTVTLDSSGYPSPLTVSTNGVIAPSAYGGDGVIAPAGNGTVVLVNKGQITGGTVSGPSPGITAGVGVSLGSVGTITNIGSISGGAYGGVGVVLSAGGLISNSGSILAGGYAYSEFAKGGYGVELTSGGTVVNSGLIAGITAGVYSNGAAGVLLLAGGTVINDGSIVGTGFGGRPGGGSYGDGGAGVDVAAGGFVDNAGRIEGGDGGNGGQSGASPSAGGAGVDLGGGSLVNSGTISGGRGGSYYGGRSGGNGVDVTAAGSLRNVGTILGGTSGDASDGAFGVKFESGSLFVNEGLVAGAPGGDEGGAFGVYKAGAGGGGVGLSGGELVNLGTIAGGAGGFSFYAPTGPAAQYVGIGGVGVMMRTGTVVNTGTISGGIGGGVYSQSPAIGSTGGAGVYIDGGTLRDQGTIVGGAGSTSSGGSGATGDAVLFGAHAGRLVITSAAVLDGVVAANTAVNDVLELARGKAGTLAGLGSQFTGFTTLAEDAGARWTLDGSNLLGGDTRLRVGGTLAVAGTLIDTGIVHVAAGGVLRASRESALLVAGATLAGGALVGRAGAVFVVGATDQGAALGRITVENGASIVGFGRVGSLGSANIIDSGKIEARGGTLELVRPTAGVGNVEIDGGATLRADLGLHVGLVSFAGDGGSLQLERPDAFTGTVSDFSYGATIDLAGLAASSATFDHGALHLLDAHQVVIDTIRFEGSYNTASFMLAGDGKGGTAITLAPPSLEAFATDRFVSGELVRPALPAARYVPMPGSAEGYAGSSGDEAGAEQSLAATWSQHGMHK